MRKHFPIYLFILLLIVELFTSTFIIMKTIFSEETYEILSAILGFVRILILGFISYSLAGELSKLYVYLIVDNLLMLSLLAMITYYFLLYSNVKEEKHTSMNLSTIFSFVVYCILLFFLNGNFRCIMKYAEWPKTNLIIYKLNRIYAVVFYIGLAAYNTCFHVIKEEQRESYLLFVITTSVYYSEFVFFISHKDQTHHLKHVYEISEQEHEECDENHLINKH